MNTTLQQVAPLMTFIRQHEAPGGYNEVWGKIQKKDRPAKLTTMTIRQILAWQDSIDARYQSEAAGGYQILEDTLRGLYRDAGLTVDALFDENGQDLLAYELLCRRGLMAYLAGTLSAEKFCNALAREWASLPVVTDVTRKERNGSYTVIRRGASYYSGDGLNRSLSGADTFLGIVKSLRGPPPMVSIDPVTQPPSGGFFVAFWAIWNRIFGG